MKLTILIFLLSQSILAHAQIKAEVNISPAGSFSVNSGRIKGSIQKTTEGFQAKKLSIKVDSLKTGIELRDKHLKEKLQANTHPSISLYNVQAKNGKGVGTLKMRGVKKKISFKYINDSGKIKAKFDLNLTDFGIDGINYMGVGVKNNIKIEALL